MTTVIMVNQAFRKGIRRGLSMRKRDLIKDRLGSWFIEASERAKREQTLYLSRAIESRSRLVKHMAWPMYREQSDSSKNIFCSYV